MERFKKIIAWILLNGTFAFMLYLAIIKNNIIAERLSLFYIWFLFTVFFLSLFVSTPPDKSNIESVPIKIKYPFFILCILFLIGNEWIFSGIAYLISVIISLGMEKEQKEKV